MWKQSFPEYSTINGESNTRFLAAYALYELGLKSSLGPLRNALASEKEKSVRTEIEFAIEHISKGADTFGKGAVRLDSAALAKALREAERGNGLNYSNAKSIAVSADLSGLEAIKRIRDATTRIPSDMGNKRFQTWGSVLKEVRRRARDEGR